MILYLYLYLIFLASFLPALHCANRLYIIFHCHTLPPCTACLCAALRSVWSSLCMCVPSLIETLDDLTFIHEVNVIRVVSLAFHIREMKDQINLTHQGRTLGSWSKYTAQQCPIIIPTLSCHSLGLTKQMALLGCWPKKIGSVGSTTQCCSPFEFQVWTFCNAMCILLREKIVLQKTRSKKSFWLNIFNQKKKNQLEKKTKQSWDQTKRWEYMHFLRIYVKA